MNTCDLLMFGFVGFCPTFACSLGMVQVNVPLMLFNHFEVVLGEWSQVRGQQFLLKFFKYI